MAAQLYGHPTLPATGRHHEQTCLPHDPVSVSRPGYLHGHANMKVMGIIGWSGSGKTALLVELLSRLRADGVSVSTIKHAHHGFDMDRPGKDSFRHREAGAHEVLVTSGARWALLHETEGPEPGLDELLGRLDPVDLVLVEGYKSHSFPKLEVHRPSVGKPAIWPRDPDVVAVASDEILDIGGRTLLPLNDPQAVVAWLRNHLDLPAPDAAPLAALSIRGNKA